MVSKFPLIGLFPFQMAFHGLHLGVMITTESSWDDPPSATSANVTPKGSDCKGILPKMALNSG